MKNNKSFFVQFKQWCLKVLVSSVIFVSVVILGGTIITLGLPPSSLNDVKSNKANYQLTAENWDYLVDQMSGQVNKLAVLSGKVSTNITNITNLSGRIATNTTNITLLEEKFSDVLSETDSLVGVDEMYVTNEINSLNTSLRQWANNTFLTGVFVPKVTYYRGVFDSISTLGEGFSKTCTSQGALSLWKLGNTKYSDVRIDYCGTTETYRKDFFNNTSSRWSSEAHD
ncbi:MAG: hypothetical protein LBD75_07280 [Candidatus Peribacteria bacterium]|jgi:hypothetical protein|nr:hypothetical protein [Candidatus Peribacteria bacterium]